MGGLLPFSQAKPLPVLLFSFFSQSFELMAARARLPPESLAAPGRLAAPPPPTHSSPAPVLAVPTDDVPAAGGGGAV